MINSGSIWNLLAQSLVKEYYILRDDNLPLGLKTLSGHPLHIFQCYDILMQVRNMQGKNLIKQQEFLGANMADCDMILDLPWLIVLKTYVEWEIEEFYFFSDKLFALPVWEMPTDGATKVGTPDSNTIGTVTDQAPPDIALVSEVKLYRICKGKRVQVIFVEWRDWHDPKMDWKVANLVGAAIIAEDIKVKPSNVVLPEKYFDFADIFDKAKANVVPGHSKYDLAIKTGDNKVPFFGLVYDYSKLELDVLREYIRDMCAKSFIVLSKSPSGAPVFFTKKKDGGLRLCVDFWGLNAITKKNKHLLPLVRTFLDMLGWAKHYTKVDIITAYHTLRIWTGDE